jgi:hypothetical protein
LPRGTRTTCGTGPSVERHLQSGIGRGLHLSPSPLR